MPKKRIADRERFGGAEDDLDYMVIRDDNGRVVVDTFKEKQRAKRERKRVRQRAVVVRRFKGD